METINFQIAIIGGGLAGAALANALVQLPHFKVHVFESAPTFTERGAAIGISDKAKVTLQELVPSVPELLDKARAVSDNSARVIIVCRVLISGDLIYTKDL